MSNAGAEKGAAEKAALFYRNFNTVGAVALFGVGVVAPWTAAVAYPLAGINVIQAGLGHWASKVAAKSKARRA